MANNDVIELGSSDEETEPAPKRRKVPPNAMVHIPGKFPPPGLTATTSKSSKSKINPASILKGSIGQAVTVTKISKLNVNPYANKNKLNGNVNPIKSSVVIKPVAGMKRNVQLPIQRNSNVSGPVLLPANRKMVNPFCKVPQKASPKNVTSLPGANNVSIVRLPRPGPVKPGIKKSPLVKPNLPPGITIKRTTPPKGVNSKSNISILNSPCTPMRMKNAGTVAKAVKQPAKPKVLQVPTVNLDDDELTIQSVSGPQWYLRPEDQHNEKSKQGQHHKDPLTGASPAEIPVEKSLETPDNSASVSDSTLETQNNKEPDKSKYIEITIEDESPVKPPKKKKGFKVGAELAITIEDSPVKTTQDETGSNNTDNEEEEQCKDHHSKKKLEYPKTAKTVQIVEIEFEPLNKESTTEESSIKEPECTQKIIISPEEPTNTKENIKFLETESADKISGTCVDALKTEKPKKVFEIIDIVEIEESPVKPIEEVKMTTPKKNKPTTTKPALKITPEIETIDLDDKERDEFSPTYQSFINLCLQLENSDDMKKIVEKKIKAYYRQVPKEYTESETFTDLVAGKIMAMKAGPEKMYLYIKDVVDELNLQRKLAKAQPAKEKEEQQEFLYGEESEFDAKRQRQIRKLEKTLKKLHRAIQKLEEQEVDFDDEEDSVYLLTESEDDTSAQDSRSRPINKEVLIQRYKERSVRVHAKLCQLTNTKMPSEARVQIEPRPGQPKGPAKRVEKWINRKVPIGTPLPFPDFHDVLRCVREANQEDKLGWNEADIMEEARDLFVRCGKKLQRRRQENEWRLAASRIPADNVDPAEDSTELRRKLEENKQMAANKETEVFNKYADRQNQLNLEAVEIGDKEAEESPIESDEEEPVEESDSLTDKEKRKERLKRLIQEKSKVSDNKGKQSDQMESNNSLQDSKKDSKEAEISSKDTKEDTEKDSVDTVIPDKEPPISNESNKEIRDQSDSSGKQKSLENKVDSDVDELHLLEKLYSDNDYNSVVGTSDTASLIAISDTSGDEKHTKKSSSDIISIENSSYSESEEKIQSNSKDAEAEDSSSNKMVEKTFDVNTELENSADDSKAINKIQKATNKTNNEERNGLLEDILFSSGEDDNTEPQKKNSVSETCINLRDDNISIGDTLIVENRDLDGDSEASKPESSDKNTITDGSSVEGMEIGTIEINSEDQNGIDSIVETVSEESLEGGNNTKIESSKSPEASEDNSEITNNSSAMTANTESIAVIFQAKSNENVKDGNMKDSDAESVTKIDDKHLHDACGKSQKSLQIASEIQSIEDISMEEILDDTLNVIEHVDKNNELVTKEDSFNSSEDIVMKEIMDAKLTEDSSKNNETEINKDLQDAVLTENTDKNIDGDKNTDTLDVTLTENYNENHETENNKDVHDSVLTESTDKNNEIENSKDIPDEILTESNDKNNERQNNKDTQDEILTENSDNDIQNAILPKDTVKNDERLLAKGTEDSMPEAMEVDSLDKILEDLF